MQLTTKFIHLTVSDTSKESMENYILEQFADMENQKEIILNCTNAANTPRKIGQSPTFDTHITAKVPWTTKPLFSKAVSEDCFQSLRLCVGQLKKQMNKSLKKIRQSHRQSATTKERQILANFSLAKPETELELVNV